MPLTDAQSDAFDAAIDAKHDAANERFVVAEMVADALAAGDDARAVFLLPLYRRKVAAHQRAALAYEIAAEPVRALTA